ncbi:uncharacterized protein [Mytilus edulis]|uniref:uncharacterized protein n=1 Tax=Mytilus edulis TaxID=6550 RepID=UPI0039EE255F
MEMNQDIWKISFDEDNNSEVFHIYDNQQDDPMYSEKLKLISDCQRLVGNDSQARSPLNIAVIGQLGCGKSSFLNTVFSSFNTDSWREIAPFGFFMSAGSQLHFTERFRSYTKEDYYRDSNNKGVLMPTFVDMTGFPDEKSETISNLLEMVLSGRINENQKLSNFVQGANNLTTTSANHYNKEVNHLPVDRIIVVSTLEPASQLPKYILGSIVEAARKNRDIPMYGVLTGRDKYNPLCNEAVAEKVKKFRQVLGLPKHRFACITNYCEDADPNMKYLNTTIPRFDVPVLRFLKQVLTPSREDASRKTVIDDSKDKELRNKLVERCKTLVGLSGQDKTPLTIAIIGTPGGGKSSFLNTVFAALSNERWIERAKFADTGKTDRQTTKRLNRYLKKHYYSKQDDTLMPTFVDMTGFEDDNSLLTKEMLNIVLSGTIDDEEKLSDMVSFGRNKGITDLKEKYLGERYLGLISKFENVKCKMLDFLLIPKRKRVGKVNRLIVVCSANPDVPLPMDLFENIIDVSSRERDITVYGVFTHMDKYSSNDPKVAEKERQFLTKLGISETRFARIKNYCPDVVPSLNYRDTTIPFVDIPVLRFLEVVLTPEPMDSVKDTSSKLHPLLKLNPVDMFVGVIVVLIGMFNFWLWNIR